MRYGSCVYPRTQLGCAGERTPVPSPPWSPSGGSSHRSRWPPLSIDPALSQLPPYQGKSQLWAPAPAPLIFPLSHRREVSVPETTCPGGERPGLGPGARHLGMMDWHLGDDRFLFSPAARAFVPALERGSPFIPGHIGGNFFH